MPWIPKDNTNRNLRTFRQYVEFDEELDRMLHESMYIYDQALYFYRQEYFRFRDSNWTVEPNYVSWLKMDPLIKETDAFKNSKLDINIKQQIFKQVCDNWFGWIAAKEKWLEGPSVFTDGQCPQMPRYKYRRHRYNTITVNHTRFRGTEENYIKLPCSNYKIRIPNGLRKDWIEQIKIKKQCNRFLIIFIYDLDKKNRALKREKALASKTKHKSYLSIDLGMKNLVTAITYGCQNEGSFIIRGTELKQVINYVNYTIAFLTSCAMLSKNKEITKISKKNGERVLMHSSKRMNDIWEYYDNFKRNYIHRVCNMILHSIQAAHVRLMLL